MKVLKFIGIFILGIIAGFMIGFFTKFHNLPIAITGQSGSLADWFSAFGTIGAVIVALWVRYDPERKILAKRIKEEVDKNDKPLLKSHIRSKYLIKINSSLSYLIQNHTPDKIDEYEENIIKELDNISNNLKKLLKDNLLTSKLQQNTNDLLNEISTLKKNGITETNINYINRIIGKFRDNVIEYNFEEDDKIEQKIKHMMKLIRKYHISKIFFEI